MIFPLILVGVKFIESEHLNSFMYGRTRSNIPIHTVVLSEYETQCHRFFGILEPVKISIYYTISLQRNLLGTIIIVMSMLDRR